MPSCDDSDAFSGSGLPPEALVLKPRYWWVGAPPPEGADTDYIAYVQVEIQTNTPQVTFRVRTGFVTKGINSEKLKASIDSDLKGRFDGHFLDQAGATTVEVPIPERVNAFETTQA